MVDNKTAHLALPLPDLSNMQDEDVPRIGKALRLIDAHAESVDAQVQGVDAALKLHDEKLQELGSSAQVESARVDLLEEAQEKEAADRAAADLEAGGLIDTLGKAQEAVALRVDALDESSTDHGARLSAVEGGITSLSTMLIGTVFPHTCADSYVPNGCVPANGGEYTRAQFPSLYDTYLAGGKLLTCSYTAWAAQVALTGNCAKFALDTTAQKFKVPLVKDGDSITQALSAAEVGKSVKAGLPNITASWGGVPYFGSGLHTYDKGAAGGTAVVSGQNLGGWTGGSSECSTFNANKANSTYRDDVTTVLTEQIRLRHFVVVASAQNNTSVFDWSNYMAALAGKLNADFSNKPSNIHYVIESWRSGTSWYRVWSDGRIEQGGITMALSGTITLFKAYSDLNYHIKPHAVHTATPSVGYGPGTLKVTTSTFNFVLSGGNIAGLEWETTGY